MPTPLLGKMAFIQFLKNDEYQLFACATDLSFKLHTDTVEVGTVGTGYWKDFEGDDNSYTIDLSGLTLFEEDGFFTSFDLIESQKQMVGLDYKIVFTNAANDVLTQIYGKALAVEGNLQAGLEFVNSAFTLVGKGEPIIGIMPTCLATIDAADVTITPPDFGFLYDVVVDNVTVEAATSYDYRLDGGAIQTSFTPSFKVNVADGTSPYGDHVLEVWAVCANGIRGVKATKNFTVSIGP